MEVLDATRKDINPYGYRQRLWQAHGFLEEYRVQSAAVRAPSP